VDTVMNFASPASPVDYARLGVETLRAGSAGTINALELAKKYGADFLQASTSECYGDPDVHPQPESYWGKVNPVGPRSVYDEAKRFGEAATMAYHRYYGVKTRLARIFNTFGPRLQASDGRVISNFMSQALRGEDLTIFGDGSQTRSFCYVSDLIAGILLLAKADEHMPVNLGNDQEFTIRECAEMVLALTGSKSKIVAHPLPPERTDDPKQRCPDLTKARALLRWEPKIGFREGLEMSLDYFKACVAEESIPK
jgi:dTDP-glucose 4,6-dehydratase